MSDIKKTCDKYAKNRSKGINKLGNSEINLFVGNKKLATLIYFGEDIGILTIFKNSTLKVMYSTSTSA
jgi:hypothetical protein